MSLDEKRFWLKKLCNDPGADPNNRWGRCPEFRNRKEKYKNSSGGYPLSKLIWIDWKFKADIPQYKLHHNFTKNTKKSMAHFSPQPLVGEVCHNKSISRFDYEKSDESKTDFAYALALARRGWAKSDIQKRLLNERTNWKNHEGIRRKNSYILRTIEKTVGIVQNS